MQPELFPSKIDVLLSVFRLTHKYPQRKQAPLFKHGHYLY